jgi:hypothetical protein
VSHCQSHKAIRLSYVSGAVVTIAVVVERFDMGPQNEIGRRDENIKVYYK